MLATFAQSEFVSFIKKDIVPVTYWVSFYTPMLAAQ